jgi:hypothetical protein
MAKKGEQTQRDQWDQAIESGAIDTELKPMRMRVAPASELTSTISFRTSVDEHHRIRAAAGSLGLSMSEYLRVAALAFANPPRNVERLQEAEGVKLLQEATELSHRLVAKLEELER